MGRAFDDLCDAKGRTVATKSLTEGSFQPTTIVLTSDLAQRVWSVEGCELIGESASAVGLLLFKIK